MAAKKLILVPEDMYNGLLSTTREINDRNDDDDRDGNINLEFTRKQMMKARDRRGKDLNAKNVNYNQELRRYLKLNR